MKIIAIVVMVLGLITIFIPPLYTCDSQGNAIHLAGGKSIPMKCLWTARAEIGLGILLLVVGIFLFISSKLESRRFLSILTLILGILIILLPIAFVGVCINPEMPCVVVMKPTLLLIGLVTGAFGIAGIVWNFTMRYQTDR